MKIRQKGVLLVEVLLALGLAVLFMTAAMFLSSISITGSEVAKMRTQANKLATEGMEALYAIRQNGGFDFNPSPASDAFITATGEYYQPTFSGGNWMLGAKSTTVPLPTLPAPYSTFSRRVMIEKVSRTTIGLACNGEIVTSGESACDDFNSRKVIVEIFWNESGTDKNYRLESYLTNIAN